MLKLQDVGRGVVLVLREAPYEDNYTGPEGIALQHGLRLVGQFRNTNAHIVRLSFFEDGKLSDADCGLEAPESWLEGKQKKPFEKKMLQAFTSKFCQGERLEVTSV